MPRYKLKPVLKRKSTKKSVVKRNSGIKSKPVRRTPARRTSVFRRKKGGCACGKDA